VPACDSRAPAGTSIARSRALATATLGWGMVSTTVSHSTKARAIIAGMPGTRESTAKSIPSGATSGTPQLSAEQLCSALESLLFVAGRPLREGELRRLLQAEPTDLRAAIAMLAISCEEAGRGLRVQRNRDEVQFVSAPENARYVAALLGMPSQARLTTAALETLATVAYRQPITRSQIEFIRGVNSDRALASLIQYGLVIEVGRASTVGRPTLFGTTADFLQQFGLSSLEALPLPDPVAAEQAMEAERTAAAERIREAVTGESG
jgi:segregation and condensation protein B